MIRRLVVAVSGTALLSGCANPENDASSIAQLGDLVPKSTETERQAAAPDDSVYRRSYGASDVKVHECATVQDDGTIVGENCPSAFVVFGPYVFAPNNSDASLSLDLEASSKLVIAGDIVSSAAKNLHAAIGDQELAAGETRRIAYKVHFYQPAEGVEARFWIRGDDPTSFKIRQLALEIR